MPASRFRPKLVQRTSEELKAQRAAIASKPITLKFRAPAATATHAPILRAWDE